MCRLAGKAIDELSALLLRAVPMLYDPDLAQRVRAGTAQGDLPQLPVALYADNVGCRGNQITGPAAGSARGVVPRSR